MKNEILIPTIIFFALIFLMALYVSRQPSGDNSWEEADYYEFIYH